MRLTPGTRIGSYEVAGLIGMGGMGEVYRARDTRLNRDVAVKVVPDLFSKDPDRLRRFKREAQLLGTLNHQNIAIVYGLEEADSLPGSGPPALSALVMELVDGPVLADRIAAGPLPFEEILSIARQLVDALEAAHGLGIVHRDLKPSNIKVRPDGTVKVLDFGLAKALNPAEAVSAAGSPTPESAGDGLDPVDSPTITSPVRMTTVGMILGTAAYMSPEQAKGRIVDKRADIWAFGCVLYEMLTGRRAFEGEDVSDTLAFVLTREPTWEALPADTPPALTRLLRRCLQKNPSRRLRDISDARLDIEESLEAPAAERSSHPSGSVSPRRSSTAWRVLPWALAGVATVVATIALVKWAPWRGAPVAREIRFEIPAAGAPAYMSISPDGRRLAYAGPEGPDGQAILWIRDLDSLESRPLPGTEGASTPDWSPDSRFIVFAANQRLMKIDVGGGPPQTLTALMADSLYQRATWSPEGVIVFSNGGRLRRVSDAGGAASDVSQPDSSLEEAFHATPWFLPDGRHFLYSAWSANSKHRAIYVGALDSTTRVRLMPSEGKVMYAEPGVLVFMRSGTLVAQPFDSRKLAFSGEAVPLAENVSFTETTGAAAFHISTTGTLIYRRTSADSGGGRELVWIDRAGRRVEFRDSATNATGIELSPDGKHVAGFEPFASVSGGTTDVWVLDLDRGVKTRLTTDPAADTYPIWKPDGSEIVFQSSRGGRSALFTKPADGAKGEQLLLAGEQGILLRPRGWSPDGKSLLIERSAVGGLGGRDLTVIDRDAERAATKEKPYLATPFDEAQATLAPNGRWVAYVSNEAGSYQVFVQPFPDPTGGKWQVSTGGGQYPRWRRDGKELYYVRADRQLIAVQVNTEGAFAIGRETVLLQVPFNVSNSAPGDIPYDVSKDGSRFLISAPDAASSVTLPNSSPITVVLNWQSRLRAR